MKCIVIDDERIAREGLVQFIKEFDFLEHAGSFSNAHVALEFLKTESVDLIFLDIQMPKLSGMEFAKMIADKACMIIFTTAFSEFALQGYKVNAIEYLVKPVFFEDFKNAVMKAKNFYDMMHAEDKVEEEPVFFKMNGAVIKLKTTQITFIKSLQNYIEVHLENQKPIIIHQTLLKTLEQLPNHIFIQIHRSYIVNMMYAKKMEGLNLIVHETSLPISRSKRSVVMEIFK